MEFSWIDIGIVVILLVSIAVAIFRGFVKEAVSLASWIAAIWLAITFSHQVALFLPSSIDDATISLSQNEIGVSKLRVGIAFVLIVIGTLMAGALLNYILSHLTKNRALRGIDRVLGGFFGFFRGAAIIVVLILAASYTNFPLSDTWKASQILPPFELVAKKVIEMMPPDFSKYFSLDEADIQASAYHF
jgi:membrane protein required for colicin V production